MRSSAGSILMPGKAILSGDLSAFNLSDMFSLISMSKKTGVLRLTRGAESRGSAPRTVAAANPWRPTVSLDPDIGVGVHLLFESSAVVGNIAAIKNWAEK